MSVDPHEAERELRDEPPTPGRKASTIVGDPQHDAETASERDRDE
jgi:hypothetical protein